MTDIDHAANGRATVTQVYDAVQALETKIMERLDKLDSRFPSIDAHDELARRIARLESETVPLSTHNIECRRVIALQSDIDKLKERMWLLAGAAAVVGTLGSLVIPWALQHI